MSARHLDVFRPLPPMSALERPLDELAVELTVYCNLKCKMCSVWELKQHGVPHELAASILNREAAIAVRNGCFCAHPYLHRLLGLTDTTELRRKLVAGEEVELPGAVRPSFGIFNDEQEVDELVRMLRVIRDRAWKGDYADVPGAAACKEL